MPMPMAAIRNSAMRTMSRAMPRSLLRRLRRLRLRIWKNLSNCSPGLVIHQASVPHQCNHWPDVGLQIKAGDSVCQKIDSQADRLNARGGSGGARQCCPVPVGCPLLTTFCNSWLKEGVWLRGAVEFVTSFVTWLRWMVQGQVPLG